MDNNIDISPIEIRDYASSHGWTLVKEAIKDGLFVLNSPNGDFKQLMFPIDANSLDFKALAEISIIKISDYTNETVLRTIQQIREVYDDVISLRYYSDNNKVVNSLSFNEALEAIEATKQMILAAGSTVANPALYHKRLSRAEAVELIKNTKFRHTEEGSFILKVSCPVKLETNSMPTLFGEEESIKPFSRKAFETINHGAIRILTAIKEDSFEDLLKEQTESQNPYISYNLCDSLSNLFDDERELPYELGFSWSRAYTNKIASPSFPQAIKFPYSFKDKIEELKSYFSPDARETADTFFGTVESLNGNIGDDGRRAGEVLLALIVEGEIINARVNLDANSYDIAYRVHGISGGGLVKVRGILQPGKRIRALTDVTLFDQVDK